MKSNTKSRKKKNDTPLSLVESWFHQHGWTPFPFQYQVWDIHQNFGSGLIHAATGTGKTYAAWMGPLLEWMKEHSEYPVHSSRKSAPLTVLWITPLRALAADTCGALQAPLSAMELPWTLEQRTGDTSSAVKARQRRRLPTALVTTPESLSLLLSQSDSALHFSHLKTVIVDEWHELLASKRGVQTELALARLRRWNPNLRTWGLSATLGNLDVAMLTLLGSSSHQGQLIQGHIPKQVGIESLIPSHIERFPWAGHIGLKLLPEVLKKIQSGKTTLIFTNTRSQTESWYQAILQACPDLAGIMAIHHGSLDREVRDWVEEGLRSAQLKCVVCTSSLDLGVDFSPVDQVIQVGSPKGVARLLQRAGRSGHQPGVESRISMVPTHALELVEVAAARDAAMAGKIEGRIPLEKPLDVLVQHAITIALGGGFHSEELYEEVRTTYSYRDLTPQEWDWVMDFVTRGGNSLKAYPDYHKLAQNNGRYEVLDKKVARKHRMSIGTIVSDPMMQVRYLNGAKLGAVEETFISRLRPGNQFTFAGKVLTLVRVKDLTAYVRKGDSRSGVIPRWMGGRMPLSNELSQALRLKLEEARQGKFEGPEMEAVKPILSVQARWSQIPTPEDLLIERLKSREGYHLFFYPFAGRLVHEGLSALWAFRLSQLTPISFTMAVNDYGIELLSPEPAPLEEALEAGFLSPINLDRDIPNSLNAAELAKRQFREIARVAGLIFTGYPGSPTSLRQLQASSNLFYDVFQNYDPNNLLLHQAHREVLDRQLEYNRLQLVLKRLSECRIQIVELERPTPFAFPLLVDRLRERLTSEKLADRIQRMQVVLEKAAGKV